MRSETKGLAEFRRRYGCAWYSRLQPANRPPKGGGTAGLHNRFSSFVWLRLCCSVVQVAEAWLKPAVPGLDQYFQKRRNSLLFPSGAAPNGMTLPNEATSSSLK